MYYSIIIIIFFVALAVILSIINMEDYKYHRDDFVYFLKSEWKNNYLLNNNLLDKPIQKKNRFAIVTFDNRKDDEYVKLHNKNIQKYSELWGYKYFFYDKCDKNVYWCKLYLVLELLKINNYDYVLWMDSDTIIKNNNISLDSIVNKYSSDIFVTIDQGESVYNAGVFIIKNSLIGITYLEDCIKANNKDCFLKNSNKLKGKWAGLCYEQGTMNKLIFEKYYKNTTCLPNYLVFNAQIDPEFKICSIDTFILHLCATPNELRKKCFLRYV